MACASRGPTLGGVKMKVSDLIKKLREERGLSQAELARASKITLATLNRLEQGKVEVTTKTLQKILDVFGMEIAFKKKS